MAFVSTKAFKCALRGKSAANAETAVLRKAFFGKAEAGEGDTRTIKFTISTDAVDLDNDTVDQSGWDLSVFLTNPLVLWMHDATELPVGKCVSIAVEDGALKATVEFANADMNPKANQVYLMCRNGFLSATSVGFMPVDFEIANDRDDDNSWAPPVDFKKQKLLEFSIVTVPANSEALIEPGQRAEDTPPAAEVDPVEEAALQAAATAKSEMDAVFNRAKRLARIL